jgi:hypothetical protein
MTTTIIAPHAAKFCVTAGTDGWSGRMTVCKFATWMLVERKPYEHARFLTPISAARI